MNEQRIASARTEMTARGVDALVVTVGSDLPYLIGYRAMENERITALVVPAQGEPTLVVPELEAPRVDSTVETRPWAETEGLTVALFALGSSMPTLALNLSERRKALVGHGLLVTTAFWGWALVTILRSTTRTALAGLLFAIAAGGAIAATRIERDRAAEPSDVAERGTGG